MKSVYVGIDLGTVNTCVAIWNEKEGKAEIFETDDGEIIPSFVSFNPKSDRILVGNAGMNDFKNYSNGIYDVKRFIGRKFSDPIVQQIYKNYPFKIEGNSEDQIEFSFTYKKKPVSKSPEEVSTEILKYIKNCLDTHYDEEIEIKAVVTNPAYFNNSQRIATRKAAIESGFTVLGLMKEPTAAALNFFNRNKNAQGLTVVFDLGGGTFDVSVVEKNGSNIKVKCSDGDNFLGGRNFEEEILNDVLEGFKNKKFCLENYQKMRLRQPIKQLKEKLSVKDEANQLVELFQNDGEDLILKMTRTKFEQSNSCLFQRCIDVIDRCLVTNKIKKSDVKNVVMVGGSSKIPKIQQMVRDYFDSNVLFDLNDYDLSVALGAAALAFNLSDSTEYSMIPPSFNINETCTMSIGNDVIFKLFELVIERNSPLPIRKTIFQSTAVNNQIACRTKWYEGNFKCSYKNHYLGEIAFTNLPNRKAGNIKFETTIEVDIDNILKITSNVRDINQTRTLTVSLYEKLEDVQISFLGWTQRDDEHFEKMALIKSIFYNYYAQFAFFRGLDDKTQKTMYTILMDLKDRELIIKEINSFVNKYDDGKSDCINLMKELLKKTESDIEVLRTLYTYKWWKKNVKS